MRKLMTITIMSLIPMVGFAKVSDFNSMISDNMSAQSQLHNTVRDNMGATRAVVAKTKAEKTVVVEAGDTVNSPTSKKALVFHKEKIRVSNQKAEFDRLATELNEAEF